MDAVAQVPDCAICCEAAPSVDARGICPACAPDAIQCDECGTWYDKTGPLFKNRRRLGCDHWTCDECFFNAKYACSACAEG